MKEAKDFLKSLVSTLMHPVSLHTHVPLHSFDLLDLIAQTHEGFDSQSPTKQADGFVRSDEDSSLFFGVNLA